MKKRNFAVRLGIVAMALTLVTTSLSSGTLAKYTETFKATGTLSVANWNVAARAKGSALMTSEGVSLGDLASTATGTVNHVASGMIAPGMKGQFTIELSMAGDDANQLGITEVDVDYVVYASVTSLGNLPKNLTFKAKADGDGSASPVTFEDTSDKELTSGTLSKETTANGKTGWQKPITIEWEWPYEDGSYSSGGKTPDQWDVTAGEGAATGSKTTSFVFKVEFTQVNPASA
ncbi:MAG: hypothetical protein J1E06_11075 [Acutalibacter sp.]|nr:hypothetical protein [Acutalibacter sp.]